MVGATTCWINPHSTAGALEADLPLLLQPISYKRLLDAQPGYFKSPLTLLHTLLRIYLHGDSQRSTWRFITIAGTTHACSTGRCRVLIYIVSLLIHCWRPDSRSVHWETEFKISSNDRPVADVSCWHLHTMDA